MFPRRFLGFYLDRGVEIRFIAASDRAQDLTGPFTTRETIEQLSRLLLLFPLRPASSSATLQIRRWKFAFTLRSDLGLFQLRMGYRESRGDGGGWQGVRSSVLNGTGWARVPGLEIHGWGVARSWGSRDFAEVSLFGECFVNTGWCLWKKISSIKEVEYFLAVG